MSRKILLTLAAWLAIFPMLASAGPVNINTADAATLARELNGVGVSRAREIVAFRKAHGRFERAEDLAQVKGIGKRLIEMNRTNILLDDDRGD